VVERGGLENRWSRKRLEGSNPSPSAFNTANSEGLARQGSRSDTSVQGCLDGGIGTQTRSAFSPRRTQYRVSIRAIGASDCSRSATRAQSTDACSAHTADDGIAVRVRARRDEGRNWPGRARRRVVRRCRGWRSGVTSLDAARLIERLLQDPGFRARFRDDPSAAVREAGFDSLIEEIRAPEGAAMETLAIRESRSSLAGATAGAALEGFGLFDVAHPRPAHQGAEVAKFIAHVREASPPAHDADAPPDLGQRPNPEALDAGGDKPDEAEPDEDEPDEDEPDEAEPDEGEPDEAEPDEGEPDGHEASGDHRAVIEDPDNSDRAEDRGSPEGSKNAGDSTNEADSPAAAEPGAGWKPEPDQYGMAGGGGAPTPIDRAVLNHANITLDANGREDFSKGRMDPRVGAVLVKLAEKHRITVSATTSDHPQSTSGGSPSNHWFGRGLDIATVDGEIVRADSAASRRLAAELATLDPSTRPTEVGSPWAIASPGYFTDAGHQNHIHIAFDQSIDPGWRPRPGLTDGSGRNDTRVMPALRPEQIDRR
jgi:hypothetical protein